MLQKFAQTPWNDTLIFGSVEPCDLLETRSSYIMQVNRILIATGGLATAEMAMRYSSFSQWLSRVWMAFMDESQQYGNYHEIAVLAAQQPALMYS